MIYNLLPTLLTSSSKGAFMKVFIPAKCGSSPRLNVGIVLSSMEEAPCSPISRLRLTSSSCRVVGIVASYKLLERTAQTKLIRHYQRMRQIEEFPKQLYLHQTFFNLP